MHYQAFCGKRWKHLCFLCAKYRRGSALRRLLRNGLRPIAQEYIPHHGGEFTVGVLSDMDDCFLGAIALKRPLSAKLSIAIRGDDFLISSGYSRGHIGPYEEICSTASAIAEAVGSRGPLNIQGRIDADGCFVPFELNPRFSASTYLRTLAGFNEVDHFIKCRLGRLTERAVREEDILR
jgi:carbamoyl-phosphate synthase large subunit